ncbi:hypothetical protein [Streptacidiphilus anmyonensis]|uniref:hypothetical protein n=1 Tax=Streptacidiphilus anmyonensis TaxID=405782 RepID=UPI000B2EA8C2|nr:hypothetical protein [Streptacidiphilus anmyonensis]
MPNNGTTGKTRDIEDELDVVDDEPTEELEAVADPDLEEPSHEDFLDDLHDVLTDEWP